MKKFEIRCGVDSTYRFFDFASSKLSVLFVLRHAIYPSSQNVNVVDAALRRLLYGRFFLAILWLLLTSRLLILLSLRPALFWFFLRSHFLFGRSSTIPPAFERILLVITPLLTPLPVLSITAGHRYGHVG